GGVSGSKIHTTTMGSKNSVKNVENAIANVLLYAKGSNRRASRSSRKNTGRNDARMIRRENISGFATVAMDRMMICLFSAAMRFRRVDSSAAQFSTMTIVASAISPMAMHRPARENRLIV